MDNNNDNGSSFNDGYEFAKEIYAQPLQEIIALIKGVSSKAQFGIDCDSCLHNKNVLTELANICKKYEE